MTSYDTEMYEKTYKKILQGYLSTNSLRTKILYLKKILHKTPIDILHIDENTIDESFLDDQFMIGKYQFPSFRRDRNKKGRRKTVSIRKELLNKRLEKLISRKHLRRTLNV